MREIRLGRAKNCSEETFGRTEAEKISEVRIGGFRGAEDCTGKPRKRTGVSFAKRAGNTHFIAVRKEKVTITAIKDPTTQPIFKLLF